MRNSYDLESCLSKEGIAIFNKAKELAGDLGANNVGQETTLLALSTHPSLSPTFRKWGMGTLSLRRLFNSEPGPRHDNLQASQELAEIIKSASKTPDSNTTPVKVGPIEMLEALIEHPRGRLRGYMDFSRLMGGLPLDSSATDGFLKDIQELRDSQHFLTECPPN